MASGQKRSRQTNYSYAIFHPLSTKLNPLADRKLADYSEDGLVRYRIIPLAILFCPDTYIFCVS
jgi:hypothetical protein